MNAQEYCDVLTDSDSDESVMSEVSTEDEIDYSSSPKSVDEPKRDLILEDSCKYNQNVQNGNLDQLETKVVVFLKVKSTQNQVFFVKIGLDNLDTSKFTCSVKTDNKTPSKNHFWSNPIDNSAETVGLSDQTS